MGFDSSHANFHFIEKVMPTRLKQYRQMHTCREHKRKVAELLYVIPYRFSSFLDCRKERAHGHLSIILIESTEELGLIDGVHGETPEPIKGYPLKGAYE